MILRFLSSELPSYLVDEGMVIVVIEVPSKAPPPISVTDDGMVSAPDKEEHSLKAPAPIVVTDEGMVSVGSKISEKPVSLGTATS